MVNDVRTELFYDDAWNAITTDVRQNPPITINWGRKNEAAKVSPSKCTLTLENKDGTYSTRHPLSPLYGKLQRNTPVRVRLGSKDVALAPLPGIDGSYLSAPDTASLDITGDIDIRMDIEPDTWRPDVRMHLAAKWRFVDDAQRSWELHVTPSGALELLWTEDGNNSTGTTVTSTAAIAEDAGRVPFRITLDVDNGASGNDVKFYTADTFADLGGGASETQLGATVTNSGTTSIHSGTADLTFGAVHDGGLFDGADGALGATVHAFELRDGIAGTLVADLDVSTADAGDTTFTDTQGNVWSLNGVAALTDTSVRFAGEVAKWPPKWDLSGADVRVPIEAAGMLRRLGQGEKPLNSSLFRDLSNKDNVPLYWPLETGSDTTIFPAATGGGNLRIFGDVSPGAFSDLDASDALPTFNAGSVRGSVDTYSPELDQRLMAVISVPENGVSADGHLLEAVTNGSAHQWIISISTSGSLRLRVWDGDGASLHDSGFVSFELNGKSGLLWLSWETNGSDIDWSVGFLEVGEDVAGFIDGTLTGEDYDRLTWLRAGTYTNDLGGLAIGHLSLLNGNIHGAFWDTASSSLRAWSGETAGDRIVRLCGEEGIPLRVIGDMSDTAAMGPQRIDTLLNLLDEAAKVDMGILVDDRDAIRLLYRARSDLYNQDVALSLDYAGGEVASTLEPVPDDQLTRNDVTVKRPKGGSYRAVLATGPMSVAAVGLYDTAPEINVASDNQLADQAHWRLHLGTVDEPRYPQIVADLTATPSKVDAATSVFVGDRVQVTNPPSWEPPDTIDQLAQGGTEKLTPHRHTIGLNCSPASPWSVVVVGTTKVDTAGSELDADISDSATSMDVRTTVGEDWTTDAAQFPLDVELGGEEMTISGIGAATGGVQTFTISARGVNGITKSHSAGDAVRIAKKHRAVVRL
ncbi:hypothetical protein [Haloechinothrix salitolerans]|uniref:Uncharacterized protein n=1 Tax=Haloechinothrix salitolerans TaxID=926830 RepID=A0ABW2BX40_9PSEU